jgi:hypothetical protein
MKQASSNAASAPFASTPLAAKAAYYPEQLQAYAELHEPELAVILYDPPFWHSRIARLVSDV